MVCHKYELLAIRLTSGSQTFLKFRLTVPKVFFPSLTVLYFKA